MRLLLALLCLSLSVAQPARAAGYLLKQGKGYAICEAFKKRLDKLGSLKEPLSPDRLRPFTFEVPGIKEADWQDLNVEKYNDLFEKLVRRAIWKEAPWHGSDEINKKRISDQFITQWREDARAGKVKLQALSANIGLFDDAPETIARIQRKYGAGKYEYAVIMYLVTDDLLDIDLTKLARASWWSSGELVLYGGKYYVVNGDFLINADFGNGFVTFCSIEFDWNTQQKEMKK